VIGSDGFGQKDNGRVKRMSSRSRTSSWESKNRSFRFPRITGISHGLNWDSPWTLGKPGHCFVAPVTMCAATARPPFVRPTWLWLLRSLPRGRPRRVLQLEQGSAILGSGNTGHKTFNQSSPSRLSRKYVQAPGPKGAS
jgi:hypothetical protein